MSEERNGGKSDGVLAGLVVRMVLVALLALALLEAVERRAIDAEEARGAGHGAGGRPGVRDAGEGQALVSGARAPGARGADVVAEEGEIVETVVEREHRGALRIEEEPMHRGVQLAEIVRPGRRAERGEQGVVDERRPGVAGGRGVAREALRDQERDIGAPLAERRHVDAEGRETGGEIVEEAIVGDQLRERAIGRDHEAHIDPRVAIGAQGLHLPVLDHVQELLLNDARRLADFVEEERPAARGDEGAGAGTPGIGEGAAHMTEERGTRERVVERAQDDGLEGLRGAWRAAVNLAREERLAGAGLAVEENRHGAVARVAGDLVERAAKGDTPELVAVVLLDEITGSTNDERREGGSRTKRRSHHDPEHGRRHVGGRTCGARERSRGTQRRAPRGATRIRASYDGSV